MVDRLAGDAARGDADRRRRAVVPAHAARRVPRAAARRRARRGRRRPGAARRRPARRGDRRGRPRPAADSPLAGRRIVFHGHCHEKARRRHRGDASRCSSASPAPRWRSSTPAAAAWPARSASRPSTTSCRCAGRRAAPVPGAARRAGGHGRRRDRRVLPPADRALRRADRPPPGGARGRGGRARRAARRDLARPAAVARRHGAPAVAAARAAVGHGPELGRPPVLPLAGRARSAAPARARAAAPRPRRGHGVDLDRRVRGPRDPAARPPAAARPRPLPRAQRPHVRHPRRAAGDLLPQPRRDRARSRWRPRGGSSACRTSARRCRSRATGHGRATAASAATRGARRRASGPDSGRRAPRGSPRPGRSRNGSSSATASTRSTPAAGCWRATSTTGRGPCATPRPRSAPTR